jgi:nucleoside-diphosphate-sugar epimerase
MLSWEPDVTIIRSDEPVLITGATGFIGLRLTARLLDLGFRHVRCLVRPTGNVRELEELAAGAGFGARLEIVRGNLLSPKDCGTVTSDVAVIYHLATSRDGRSYPDSFLNSVVTTRNLLDAANRQKCLKRFVNVSSLAVYANTAKPGGRVLDETCPVDRQPQARGDAYCFSKVRQDELVEQYGREFGVPYVIVRPGYVYGPGKAGLSSRVGIDTFGVFLHLGGANRIPLTYVDNCADAIALSGVRAAIEKEVFNITDDDLPSSRRLLSLYKANVRSFRSLYVPHSVSYALCYLWERYSAWSEGQLPPVFNRPHWHVYWKKTEYTNRKLKEKLGWTPRVSMSEGLRRYFDGCREDAARA